MSASFACSKWGASRCPVRPVNRQQFPARRSRAGGGGAWGDSGQLVHPRIVAVNRLQLTRGAGVPRSFLVEGSYRAPAARLPASAPSPPDMSARREETPPSIYQGHLGAKNETGNRKFYQKIFRMVSRPRSMEICTARQLTPSARAISSMDRPSR